MRSIREGCEGQPGTLQCLNCIYRSCRDLVCLWNNLPKQIVPWTCCSHALQDRIAIHPSVSRGTREGRSIGSGFDVGAAPKGSLHAIVHKDQRHFSVGDGNENPDSVRVSVSRLFCPLHNVCFGSAGQSKPSQLSGSESGWCSTGSQPVGSARTAIFNKDTQGALYGPRLWLPDLTPVSSKRPQFGGDLPRLSPQRCQVLLHLQGFGTSGE